MPADKQIRQITAGREYTCAIGFDGRVYCWGRNTYGQLGDGSTTSRSTAVIVAAGTMPNSGSVRQITAGQDHTCAIGANYKAYCWGLNLLNQLGDGTTTQRITAGAVSQGAVPTNAIVGRVSANVSHTCLLASDNKVYCWGSNANGQLGDGTVLQRSTPVNAGPLPAYYNSTKSIYY